MVQLKKYLIAVDITCCMLSWHKQIEPKVKERQIMFQGLVWLVIDFIILKSAEFRFHLLVICKLSTSKLSAEVLQGF